MKNVFILICCILAGCVSSPEIIISTDKGKVEGRLNEDQSVRIFKGIPFAASPVGELRWKAPQPTEKWDNLLQCTSFGASPVQNTPKPFYCWTEEFIAQPEPLSEDCLYLNVWTTAKSEISKQPVFVWIYGGGLSSGSSNCDIYDGEEMSKKGVVFVSINYRVGALGFMAHPELSKESGHNASGNYGLMDQIAALQWVQENIDKFGGDPNNVTIAGQSAGAFSVNSLIATNLAEGLFHKAILQSGGLLSGRSIQDLAEAEAMGQRLMQKAGKTSIAELREIPATKLQELSNDQKIGRFGITREDYVIPRDLMSHFKNGKQNQVPVIAGWVLGDGDFLGDTKMTTEEYREEALEQYGDQADSFLAIFSADSYEEVKNAKSKLSMLNFAGLTSHLLADYNTQSSFLYQFGHVPPDKPDFPNYGAFHTSEVPYALHTLHKWNRPWADVDLTIEETLSSYWVNFAKTGDPNGVDLPLWESYQKQSGSIMAINTEMIGSKRALLKKEFDFLQSTI